MKSWTVTELENIAASLTPLVGARLQEVQTSDQDLILGFYGSSGMLYLWADLNPQAPTLLPWTELPLHVPARKNPVHLFLRAHFRDRVLRAVERPAEMGRVVRLRFDHGEIEIRLFPHGRNVIARTLEGKQVAWQKPKDLSTVSNEEPLRQPRGLEELREDWLTRRGKKGSAKSKTDVRAKIEAEIAKKRKALEKIQEDLECKRETPWKAVGEWIKTNQSLDVPREWEPYVDRRRKLSWNIEECFQRARDMEGKITGTENRLAILREEIERLEARKDQPLQLKPSAKPPEPLKVADAQGRTLRLSDEITVVTGKSAADNLKLLRKARAWDWWFHLRDVPSSHAILFRNKSTPVTDAIVQQVLAWYVRQHLGAKYKEHAGEKFFIQIAECRHVRPIKGDKLGRVTVHHERVLPYVIPS